MSSDRFFSSLELMTDEEHRVFDAEDKLDEAELTIKGKVDDVSFEFKYHIDFFDAEIRKVHMKDVRILIDRIESYYAFGDVELPEHPILLQFLKLHRVSLIRRGVASDSLVVAKIDDKQITVYAEKSHCLIYLIKTLRNKAPPYTKVRVAPNQSKEMSCVEFYINSYLACMPDALYKKTILGLFGEVKRGNVLITNLPAELVHSFRKATISEDLLVYYGFFGINSISKKAAGDEAYREQDCGYITEWVTNRSNALAIKCKFGRYRNMPKIAPDLISVARYLDDTLGVRQVLFAPLLGASVTGNHVWSALRAYTQMIQEYTGLTAFRLAYDFAEACETQAHTLEIVVKESISIIKTVEDMKRECGEGIDWKFYYLMKGQKAEQEMNHYRHLAFCAAYKKKVDNPGSSWDNLKHTTGDLNVAKTHLMQQTSVPLKSAAQLSGMSQIVQDYLMKKNKEVDTEHRHIVAPLPPPAGLL